MDVKQTQSPATLATACFPQKAPRISSGGSPDSKVSSPEMFYKTKNELGSQPSKKRQPGKEWKEN